MELIFAIGPTEGFRLNGEIVSWSVAMGLGEPTSLEIDFITSSAEVIRLDVLGVTKVLKLPGLVGAVRLGGTNQYSTEVSRDKGHKFSIKFWVVGLYPTHQEACAAEMAEIMEKGNK